MYVHLLDLKKILVCPYMGVALITLKTETWVVREGGRWTRHRKRVKFLDILMPLPIIGCYHEVPHLGDFPLRIIIQRGAA